MGMENKESPHHATLRQASILIPLFECSSSSSENAAASNDNDDDNNDNNDEDDGIHVLLTCQPMTMTSLGREVCLPGGKMDNDLDDNNNVHTELHKAYKEVGVVPSYSGDPVTSEYDRE